MPQDRSLPTEKRNSLGLALIILLFAAAIVAGAVYRVVRSVPVLSAASLHPAPLPRSTARAQSEFLEEITLAGFEGTVFSGCTSELSQQQL